MARDRNIIERLNDVAGRMVAEGSEDAEVVCEAVRVLRASDRLVGVALERYSLGDSALLEARALFTRISCQHCGGFTNSTMPFCGECGNELAKPPAEVS